ncbi:hypothetical protein SND68_03940, partial [Escherichia coli]|nr:hypothetical protein [Escherichia coli]
NRMLKRRDAFLKKSALAVSVALLLSSQALAQAHKTLTESSTGIIWIDNGTQSLESASVIDSAYFHERRSLNNFHRDRVITFEQIA